MSMYARYAFGILALLLFLSWTPDAAAVHIGYDIAYSGVLRGYSGTYRDWTDWDLYSCIVPAYDDQGQFYCLEWLWYATWVSVAAELDGPAGMVASDAELDAYGIEVGFTVQNPAPGSWRQSGAHYLGYWIYVIDCSDDPFAPYCDNIYYLDATWSLLAYSVAALQLAPPVPAIQITNADIVADQIAVSLGPAGQSGTLVIGAGSAQVSATLFNGTRSSGDYIFSFDRDNLPLGQYETVTASWVTAGGTAQAQYNARFLVLGHDWRQSRYNIPYEGNCTGGTSTGYLVTYSQQQCTYNATDLNTNFMNRVGASGSGTGTGRSINNGILRSEFAYGQCTSHGNVPGDRDFRQDGVTTACAGTAFNYVADSTVAAPFNLIHSPSPRAGCGNQFLIVNPVWGISVKNVTDYCPHCNGYNNGHQFDNFITNEACTSALGQVDNTTVIQLN